MRIPIQLRPGRTARRGVEPLTFGVPLPRRAVRDVGAWTLERDGTAPLLAEARGLDRWGDGSLRWALVDVQLTDASAASDGWFLNLDPAAPVAPAPRSIVVTEEPGRTTVDTGAARFLLRAGGRFPFESVEIGGRQMLAAAGGGFAITGESGAAATVIHDKVTVEHRGVLRVVIAGATRAQLATGRTIEIDGRFEFFAGSSIVRLRCTLRNPDRARHPGNFWDLGDPGSVLIRDASLTFTLASSDEPPRLTGSLESGAVEESYAVPFEIYQDSSGGEHWKSSNHINRARQVPNSFRGYRVVAGAVESHGVRATPIVSFGSTDTRVGIAVPAFWQNFPRAIEARDNALVIRFFPGQYSDLHELQGGEQKTHECFVAFGPDATVPSLEWCRNRTIASARPEWTFASEAVDVLAPLDARHRALVDAAIEGPDRFERKREVIDEYGWRHFGEIYGDHEAVRQTSGPPLVSHYNNQYDPIAGFALQFLRTGDVRWWTAMTELAAHVIDIDIYHTDRDKAAYNGGLFWHTYHYGDADTATHRSYPLKSKGRTFGGGPSADHNYPTGLMLHYFLTGDEASKQTAVGLAEYVLRLDDGHLSPFRWLTTADTGGAIATWPNFFGPARSSGDSLNALVDGHRLTGDRRFLDKADRLVRRVVHPADDIVGKNQLDEPEIRWFYQMFLQALGKYLHHRAERGLLDEPYAYGRAVLLHYAQWMAEHEYPYLDKPEKLEFPTETWAAQDIRKSDILYYAALHSDAPERARFTERAAFFFETSIATLERMPTRALARPIVVLLTSGFLHSWFTQHPTAAEPVPTDTGDFGMPERFVPQRAIAERRAKWLAAASAVIAGAAALIWWL